MKRVLLVPSVRRGNGSGHLVRCLSLARELGPGARVYVSRGSEGASWSAAEITLAFPGAADDIVLDKLGADERFDLVLLDRRDTSAEELETWLHRGPVVALDEGGAARRAAPYLVDALPLPPARRTEPGPNLSSRGYLDLPVHRRQAAKSARKALLAFGGEDPAGLGPKLARFLVERGFFEPSRLTLVSGALSRPGASRETIPEGIAVLGPVQNLKEHLSSWDLVFTSFGLTAFEASWAGCLVAVLDPSAYHAALSREAGFPSIGTREPETKALSALLEDLPAFAEASARPAPPSRESLAEALGSLQSKASGRCPACSSPSRSDIERFPDRSYFRCRGCGLLYMEGFADRPGRYGKDYFFEEYRAQYGRTYLEDWPVLTALAAERLDRIDRLVPAAAGKGRKLLDVGCAYGAFVSEASRREWESYGLDLAGDAVAHVRDTLRLPAMVADFQDPLIDDLVPDGLDCVSMWYVVEHFSELGAVLERAARLLSPGGVLALSTPSGSGISARKDRRAFLAASPYDHLSVWEPERAARLLARFGFRVELVRSTGHHPERFPGAREGDPGWIRSLRGTASRFFRLGDTFEIYARRLAPKGTAT
ncbi:MAG: methyltransferase domain-containing protein [Spirochaetales bacterium]|nr:methyltransferase domain-containing protein [Spirochaetales bacterium]